MKTSVNNNRKDNYQIGDKVKHNWYDDVATVTAKRQVYIKSKFGLCWLYTLDFGHSVMGPFGKDYNGEEFLAEALTPVSDGTRLHEGDRVRVKTNGREATIYALWLDKEGDIAYVVDYGEQLRRESDGFEYQFQEFSRDELEALTDVSEPPREVVLQDTCEIKAASKREQTQTGLQSAERERAQLKVKAVCIEGVSLTAEKRAKWVKNFGDIIREHTTQGRETQYNHDCGCIRVNVAYRNDSDKPEDWTYCVAWYKWLDIVTEKRELVECENGVRLEQAARAMADFHLLADAGLTLREILYPAA